MKQEDTLSKWEAEATHTQNPHSAFDLLLERKDHQILALIELIRKKDEALKLAENARVYGELKSTKYASAAKQALALNEELK